MITDEEYDDDIHDQIYAGDDSDVDWSVRSDNERRLFEYVRDHPGVTYAEIELAVETGELVWD